MNGSKKVVIAGYVRSPFTPATKGELKNVRADDLVAQTVQGLIRQTGVDAKLIEDLKLGCAFPEGEQGLNMARQVVFLAGLPHESYGILYKCGFVVIRINVARRALQEKRHAAQLLFDIMAHLAGVIGGIVEAVGA